MYPPYGGVLAAQPGAPMSEPWDLDVGPYNPLSSSGLALHPPGSCSKAAPVGTSWCVSPARPVGLEHWIRVQGTQNCWASTTARYDLSSRSSHPPKPQQPFALQVGKQIASRAPGGPPGGYGEKRPKRNEWRWAAGASEMVRACGGTGERRNAPLASINRQQEEIFTLTSSDGSGISLREARERGEPCSMMKQLLLTLPAQCSSVCTHRQVRLAQRGLEAQLVCLGCRNSVWIICTRAADGDGCSVLVGSGGLSPDAPCYSTRENLVSF